MPFIHSKLSVSVTEEQKEKIKSRLGKAIECIPGKSESWLMVSLEENCSLYFKGEPFPEIAFVEVKLFGKANRTAYEKLTAEICQIYKEELSIPSDHVYVTYEEVEHWGWNGSNF